METTAGLDLRGMARFLLLSPPSKHARWLGGSTAGPSHSETSATEFAVLQRALFRITVW